MSLISELRRRNVLRVAVAYIVASWLFAQVIELAADVFETPAWVMKFIITLLAIGIVPMLVLSWIYEITPEGIKLERDIESHESVTAHTAKKLDIAVILMLIGVVGLTFFYVPAPSGKIATSAEQTSMLAAPSEQVSPPATPTLDEVVNYQSIAVLPFQNISQDATNAPFTIGIHDDLITHLSKISSLKTISRTSVLRYGDSLKSIPEIAAELGVNTVLEGSVQQAGDLVRINVKLVDANANRHLWGESYERQLTASNIFSIQNEIVKAIAEALYAKLTPDEQVRIEKVPTASLAALRHYFLGRQNMAARHSVALQEAIEHFKQAIALDPDFALAYVGLSDIYQLQEDAGSLARDEMFAKALPAIDKAFELDSELGPAYNSLGGLKYLEGDAEEAERLFERSIALNPNYATTYLWYGLMLVDLGRIEKAIILYRKGIERDPLSSQLLESLGTAMEYQGRFSDALVQYKRSTEVNTTFATSYTYIGNINWLVSGHIDQAIACHKRSIDLDPGARLVQVYLGLLYLDVGNLAEANQWITSALRLAPYSLEPRAAMALLDKFRGNGNEWIEHATAIQEINPYYPDARLFQTMALAMLRNKELQEGNLEQARALYEKNYQELLNDDVPVINWQNYRPAIDLALVLQKSGDAERAALLLNLSLAFIESGKVTRLGIGGYGISDVHIHTLKGEQLQALTALKQAISQGWQGFWWFFLKNNLNLESLQDNAEFQALVAQVESAVTSPRATSEAAVSCAEL